MPSRDLCKRTYKFYQYINIFLIKKFITNLHQLNLQFSKPFTKLVSFPGLTERCLTHLTSPLKNLGPINAHPWNKMFIYTLANHPPPFPHRLSKPRMSWITQKPLSHSFNLFSIHLPYLTIYNLGKLVDIYKRPLPYIPRTILFFPLLFDTDTRPSMYSTNTTIKLTRRGGDKPRKEFGPCAIRQPEFVRRSLACAISFTIFGTPQLFIWR